MAGNDLKTVSVNESSPRSWRKRLAFGGAALAIGLLGAELLLRLMGFSYPAFYTYDDIRGGVLRPHAEGWWRTEGEAYVRINAHGFHDVPRKRIKPPGTYRIAVLGDSFVEAFHVSLPESLTQQMETRLSHTKLGQSQRLEVLNFGVSGYGTTQEYLTLKHLVWSFDPDLVLLGIFAGNDIQNNCKELEPDHMRPFFQLQEGKLNLDTSYVNGDTYRIFGSSFYRFLLTLSDYSRVLQLVRKTAISLTTASADNRQSASSQDRSNPSPQEQGLTVNVLSPPKAPSWSEAWKITEQALLLIKKEAQAHGTTPLGVFLIPQGQRVHPDPAHKKRIKRNLHVSSLSYPETRIVAFCEKHQIPVLDLGKPMADHAVDHKIFFHGFKNTTLGQGHFNTQGHAFAADQLVQWLGHEGLIPTEPK